MAQPRVQALPHQGVPAPQGRRIPCGLAGVELSADAGEGQLQNPYRCHQGAADTAPPDQGADHRCLCQRSRLAQCCLVRITAAQWRAGQKGKTGEAGNMRDTATLEQLVVLSNLESINQRRADPSRLVFGGTVGAVEWHCYYANAVVGGEWCAQTAISYW